MGPPVNRMAALRNPVALWMKPAATHWLPPATLCKPQVFVAAIDAGLEAVSRLLRTVRVAAHCPTPPRSPAPAALVAPGHGVSWLRQRRPIPQVSRPPGSAAAPCRTTGNPSVAAPQSCWFCIPDLCVTIHLQAKWKGRPQRSPWRSAPPFTVPKWRNWQTRMVQVHVLARVWGFESLLRHQKSSDFPIYMVNLSPSKDLLGFHMFGFCLLSRSRCPL